MAEEAKILGNAEYQRNNYHLAIQHYSRAISLQPNEPAYYGNRSAAYFMMYKYEEALLDCRKGLELKPGVGKLLLRAGKCLMVLGKLQEARDCYVEAAGVNPDNEVLKADLTQLKDAQISESIYHDSLHSSNLPSASRALDQLLTICTHSLPYKTLKLDLLIQSQLIPEALSYASTLPAADLHIAALTAVANYYQSFPIPDKAKEALRAISRTDPDNPLISKTLRNITEMERTKETANRLYRENRCIDAIEAYTQALRVDAKHAAFNSLVLTNRAAAFMRENEQLKALEDLNEAVTLNKGYLTAYMRRGNVYSLLDRFEEALHDYNTVKNANPTFPNVDQAIFDTKERMKYVRKKDYYQVLGLQRTATDVDVKKAYRQLAMKWHPDKNSDTQEKRIQSEKMIKDINEAYSVLSDTEKRRKYDVGMDIDGEDMGGMGDFTGGMGDFSAEMGRFAANLADIESFFTKTGGIPDLDAAGSPFEGRCQKPVITPGEMPGMVKVVWKMK